MIALRPAVSIVSWPPATDTGISASQTDPLPVKILMIHAPSKCPNTAAKCDRRMATRSTWCWSLIQRRGRGRNAMQRIRMWCRYQWHRQPSTTIVSMGTVCRWMCTWPNYFHSFCMANWRECCCKSHRYTLPALPTISLRPFRAKSMTNFDNSNRWFHSDWGKAVEPASSLRNFSPKILGFRKQSNFNCMKIMKNKF